ncbi:MAG: sulfotransferase [Chloroflexota bacterium]|nr:MAG: sulfotransferase [Chloroflexota bacterium]
MSHSTTTPLFIFSLPRAGSTLLQRLLAAHTQVATLAESFLLAPFLFTLRKDGVYGAYNHQFTALGIRHFYEELPQGKQDYLRELRRFALRLYGKASPNKERFFLDKAAAYSLIAGEIIDLFPQAKSIFLWRNPLSVVASLMKSWRSGKWNLYYYDRYLYEGLPNLIRVSQSNHTRSIAVRYEALVREPEGIMKEICSYLDLSYEGNVLTDYRNVPLRPGTGDPLGLNLFQSVSQAPIHKWQATLANPLRKIWCRRYLQWLGDENLAYMGYDLDELQGQLNDMPTQLKHVGSDLWRMPYGLLFRLFDGVILRDKLQYVRRRQRIYAHR